MAAVTTRKGLCAPLLSALLFVLLTASVLAECECGYRVTVPATNNTSTTRQYVVTDLLETNFANISDISKNTDWVRQNWSVDAAAARGAYGQMMAVEDVVSKEGDGLQITVAAGSEKDGDVDGGEIDTARVDVLYGTFRSSMKVTDVAGTVSAFFWYYNDTQEIDMEFLSKDFNTSNASYPINLVLQSDAAARAGYNAAGTDAYQVIYLPFDPRSDFHEYRVDWVPGRVLFYADGAVLAEMDDPAAVPTHAGHLAISQWSNGNPAWSGGPPASDAVLEVRYVKAYFNSSDAERRRDFDERCTDRAAVCDVPDVTATNSSAAGWFFSGHKNMTANQTVSSDSGITGGDESGGRAASVSWAPMSVALLVAGLVAGL